MACPICGRTYCDHTPEERGQTFEEMMKDVFTPPTEENGESEDTREKQNDDKEEKKS